jgi:mRNA interferase RelE/StbE
VASYSIEIKRSAAKELAHIPSRDRGRVIARIQALANDPRPHDAERLSGLERYRMRQGDYRILHEVEDQVLRIIVVRVAHRREAYRP